MPWNSRGTIIGPQGPQGIQGVQGIQGEKGDTGAQGTPGIMSNVSAQIRRSTTQSIPNGTDTLLVFSTADWNHGATLTTAGITIITPGVYFLEASCPWAANGTGRRNLKILRNSTTVSGAILIQAQNALPWENVVSVAGSANLAQGDILRAMVAQDSGGALNVAAIGSVFPTISATLLRAA